MPLEYHAPTKRFTVGRNEIEQAACGFLFAIKMVREAAGLPLTPYERPGHLEPADHAQKAIVDSAKVLGIDLGSIWGNELDVSKVQ